MQNKTSIQDLLQRYHTDSYGWAMVCCQRDREEAKEVLQTTYLKILEGKARIPNNPMIKSWLFKVIRNTAIDLQRKRINQGKLKQQYSIFHYQAIEEELVKDDELENQLATAMQQLSQRQMELLHLVFYQGQTLEEAASILQLKSGTARSHYARGKENLKKILLDSKKLKRKS